MSIWSIELIILMVMCAKIFWISVSECLKIIYFVIAQLSERSKIRSLNHKNFRSKRPNWALKNGELGKFGFRKRHENQNRNSNRNGTMYSPVDSMLEIFLMYVSILPSVLSINMAFQVHVDLKWWYRVYFLSKGHKYRAFFDMYWYLIQNIIYEDMLF